MNSTDNRFANGLWFEHQAEEAAKFYTSIFPNSSIDRIVRYGKEGREIHGQQEGTVMVATFRLSGLEFQAINGGPRFHLNPSISFYVVTESESETRALWNHLSKDGAVLMPLGKYDWNENYGWTQDRYGLSWQIGQGKIADVGQKITPLLMFVGEHHARAENAMNYYMSIFKNPKVDGLRKYGPGGQEPEGTVMHAQFRMSGQTFMVMDSAEEHNFSFNEAISLIVKCADQKEIDYYWAKLSHGGEESKCGWLKDKFGVSWQVQPVRLGEMLADPDTETVARVTKTFLQMKKFDLAELERAFNGELVHSH